MKKSIVISMALFVFAFEANASVVSLSRAKNVARSWLVRFRLGFRLWFSGDWSWFFGKFLV